MRLAIGRLLAAAVLTSVGACAEAAPVASPSPSVSAGPSDTKTACDAVAKARETALTALAPVAAGLAATGLSTGDLDKATHTLRTVLSTLHADVAATAERVGDPQLKAKVTAYQLAVEEAIVVVEGADGDQAALASAIALPSLRSAEGAVLAACA